MHQHSTLRAVLIFCAVILLGSALLRGVDIWIVIIQIIQFIALEAMLRESDIARTQYIRPIYAAIGIFIIGSLFKIMHWPNGELLIIVAISMVAITYTVRTIRKTPMLIIDILKWLWVISMSAMSISNTLQWNASESLSYVSTGIFFLMLLGYFVLPRKEGRPTDKPLEEDIPIDQL